MVRLLPMLFALFFIVQSTACYSTALFEDKALEYDLAGHMEFAVADGDTLVAVSYTHLTLPTTPYV